MRTPKPVLVQEYVEKAPQKHPEVIAKYLNPNWQARNERDLQEMSENHEKLINLILSEEEELISAHRNHIDDMVGIVKDEMNILHEVDQPGSDVDEYIGSLKNMLDQKLRQIRAIQSKLENFTAHLRTEEEISRKFYKLQTEVLDLQNN